MKFIKITLACFFSVFILVGCINMKQEKVLSKDEVEQLMLDHIENKYNEEFEVFSMDYKSWYNGYVEIMHAYPKGGNPNYHFYVERNGDGEIYDDYALFAITPTYIEKMNNIIKQYFPNAVTKCGLADSGPIPNSFMPNMDLKEFEKFANKKITFNCSIYLSAEKEEDIEKDKITALENELKQLNDIGSINILGYSAESFQKYIIDEQQSIEYENTSYSTNGLNFEIRIRWGEVDFDYQYKEEE